MTLEQVIPLVVPLLAIQLALIVIAFRDLLKTERRVRGESKLVWGLVIIVINFVGPILYLVWGRIEE